MMLEILIQSLRVPGWLSPFCLLAVVAQRPSVQETPPPEAPVSELIRLLGSDDEAAVRQARQNLSQRGLACVPDLLAVLDEDDADARRLAAEGLGVLGDRAIASLAAWGEAADHPERWSRLVDLAGEPALELEARSQVAQAMLFGTAEANRGLAAVSRLLASADEPGRVAAAHALGTLGSRGRPAVVFLMAALQDSSEWVRLNVIQALGSVLQPDPGAGTDLGRAMAELRNRGGVTPEEALWLDAEGAGLAGSGVAAGLPDRALADRAAERLRLVFESSDQTPAIRAAAAQAIGRLGGVGLEWLIEGLGRPETLGAAAEAIAGLDTPPIEALVAALRTGTDPERIGAAVALAEIGAGAVAALDPLVEALKDPCRDLRLRVAWALGEIGLQAVGAAPALRAFGDRGDRIERVWADFALIRVDPLSGDRIDGLIEVLQGPDEMAVRHARDAIALLDQKAVLAVSRKIRRAGQAERGRLVDLLARLPVEPQGVVPVLVGRLLNDPSASVRARAATALATLGRGARMALAALRDARADRDARVREAARAAILVITAAPAGEASGGA